MATAEEQGYYQVNEMFWTVQGEGSAAGRSAVFIRLQGCPVGCPWCDSKTTWYQGGKRLSIDEIRSVIDGMPASDLFIVTGGEPLIHNLDPLFDILSRYYQHREIHVETSGHYPYKGAMRPRKTVVSPKFGYTRKDHWYIAPNVYDAISGYGGEFKYVVDKDFNLDVVLKHMSEYLGITTLYGEPITLDRIAWEVMPPVILMPEGCPPHPENVERTIEYLKQFPMWRFGPRLQYAYSSIEKMEGINNKIIAVDEARERAKERVYFGREPEKEHVEA